MSGSKRSDGEIGSDTDSDSCEEEDEVGKELTDDVEKDFFRTLCFLKKKDPKIYDKNVRFFKEEVSSNPMSSEIKKRKNIPLMLRDYERNLLTGHGGTLSDDEPERSNIMRPGSPTYVEEQQELRETFRNIVNENSECETDSEDKLGGLFEKRCSTEKGAAQGNEDEEYVKWLKGKKDNLHDKEIESDLKFLHDYWNNPSLDAEEKFLRDYILNKRFLENDATQPVDYTQLSEEERELEEQTEFEYKYNYRFEEPDREFIKRYPRIMGDSLRRKNERRKEKREEVKKLKLQEKEKKRQELKRLMNLKEKEVLAKIEELKTLTGNQQLAFEADSEDDFDASKHDRLMEKIFNEDFYSQDDPGFNKELIEEELWNNGKERESNQEDGINMDLYCEDPNFVMDCDYSPEQAAAKKKETRCRRRKDKHKRTTFSEIIHQEKPLFDPETHKTFESYLDEYYDIDCEDFIGDLPCRYKYSQTVANSYGLTIEEILAADDKELDRWCSMKRVTQLQPEYKELNDLKVFEKKGQDEMLKRKILPSLYKTDSTEDTNNEMGTGEDTNHAVNCTSGNKKKHKKKKKSVNGISKTNVTNKKSEIVNTGVCKKRKNEDQGKSHKTKIRNGFYADSNRQCAHKKEEATNKKHASNNSGELKYSNISDARLQAYGIKPKKFKNKLKYGKLSKGESW